MNGVVSYHIEPGNWAGTNDVYEVVPQQIKGVDEAIHRVEAIGLLNVGNVVTKTSLHIAVCHTFGDT